MVLARRLSPSPWSLLKRCYRIRAPERLLDAEGGGLSTRQLWGSVVLAAGKQGRRWCTAAVGAAASRVFVVGEVGWR